MHKSLMQLSEEEFVNEVNKAFVSRAEGGEGDEGNGVEPLVEDIGHVQTERGGLSHGTRAILLATGHPR